MSAFIFPAILSTLSFAAAFVCFVEGQPWKVVYWCCAGVIAVAAAKM